MHPLTKFRQPPRDGTSFPGTLLAGLVVDDERSDGEAIATTSIIVHELPQLQLLTQVGQGHRVCSAADCYPCMARNGGTFVLEC